MKAPIKTLITLLFISLFIYAASSKLLDTGRFRSQLYLQPFPHSLADLLVYGLPALEILTAVLLAFKRTRFIGLALSATMMAVFTAYISLVLFYFPGKTPCSCGGILNHMSWTTHLIFNWAFLLAGVIALIFQRDHTT